MDARNHGPKDDESDDKDDTQTVGDYVTNPASWFDGLAGGGSKDKSDDGDGDENE